jgi:serine/threonine protein kinase
MELVRGIRITDYCNQANLSTKERLDLFIKVCQAIQHAHLKGIIHRDIKPSNILVTLHDGVKSSLLPKRYAAARGADFRRAKTTTSQKLRLRGTSKLYTHEFPADCRFVKGQVWS